ncbi:MAG TPA: GNAT family N-acetyltransferase [Usitatibacter sp.]|nr:GNAT family N-acetyltransferase [Usitatibacter sp.]
MAPPDGGIVEARDVAEVALCRELFVEYQRSLGVSLCFQGFDRELATLPGDYAPPRGRLLLAWARGEPAGCVAVRPVAGDAAEMKRLYVRPAAQGAGLGRRLAQSAVDAARELGYASLLLDTLPTMHAAQALYTALGFRDTAPYNDNPVAGVRFMALDLRSRR